MKLSTLSILVVLCVQANVVADPTPPPCITFLNGGTLLNMESLGVLQAVSLAGPNGFIPYTPPDNDPTLVSLAYTKQLSTGLNTSKDFNAYDHEYHFNNNGSGQAIADWNYEHELFTNNCGFGFTGTLDYNLRGTASVNTSLCATHFDPAPEAKATASGSVINVITIPFVVLQSGNYSFSGNSYTNPCHPTQALVKTAKIFDPSGQQIAAIDVSTVSQSLVTVNLPTGLCQIVYVLSAGDSTEEVKAECGHTSDQDVCNSTEIFAVYLSKQ